MHMVIGKLFPYQLSLLLDERIANPPSPTCSGFPDLIPPNSDLVL